MAISTPALHVCARAGSPKPYYTFLGEEGKQAIKKWLMIREQKFGAIREGDPIFLVRHNKLVIRMPCMELDMLL